MDLLLFLYSIYIFLGILLVIFNKSASLWIYRLILLFTDKLNISGMFLFRVDSNNRDSFYFLIRFFCVIFGLMLAIGAFFLIV